MLSFIKRNYIFASPLLIALYTVTFLYANNIKEFRLDVLPLPILIVVVYASLIFLITNIVLKRVEVSALVSTVVLFATLSYVRVYDLVDQIPFVKDLPNKDISTTAIVVLVAGLLIFLIIKNKERLLGVNRIVTLLLILLVGLSIFQIAQYEAKTGRSLKPDPKEQKLSVKPVKYDGPKPDIYYFIFDRYAGQRSLQEQYGFDNSHFLNFLKDKGFYVTENSTTNYPKTFLSLGSSLNMEYLNFLTDKTGGGASSDESVVTPLIRGNKVLEFLKARGYTIVNMGSWWEQTNHNQNADYNFVLHYGVYPFADEFTTGYLNTTIAAPILKATFRDPQAVSVDPQNNLHRKMAFYEFGQIGEIMKIKGPKFVFVHILLPHDPFVVDKNCNPISEKVVNKNSHQVNYVNQLQCANKQIEKLATTLLSNSKKPPVIVFQADEGPFPMNSPLPPKQGWGKATVTSWREKFPILNAYYFPGIKDTKLYNTITPVNSFRVLLNDYFGTDYPLLPDKNYVFEDEDHYYQFKEVTDKVAK